MPLFKRSGSAGGGTPAGFRPPAEAGRRRSRSAPSESIEIGSGTVPHFIPRMRIPAGSGGEDAMSSALKAANASRRGDDGAERQPLRKIARVVVYPDAEPKPTSSAEAIVKARLARRTDMSYHQPETAGVKATKALRKGKAEEGAAANDGDDSSEEGGTPPSTNANNAAAAMAVAGGAARTLDADGNPIMNMTIGPDGQPVPAAGGEAEVEDEVQLVVPRYPVSPYGKLYFQVETEGATRHESVGIIIIDTEQLGVMMYDRLGRQFGNREDPGYPIREVDAERAKAGEILKVGPKNVLLITALCEEVFRSGEFFLRSEHDLRIKEDKAKAKAEAAAQETAKAAKPRMSFGASLCGNVFAAQLFRRRPRDGETGFVVPIAGRPKMGKNGLLEDLTPLHDADRPGAVVLFRADYKRDMTGRRQVSVVVDPVIGDKLRPHQRIGVKFLFDCITGERMPGYHGAILADEMGLGKTIQTVATIYTCLKQGKHGRVTARKCLVVTPSSLVKNWCNEFDKWLGEGAVKHFAISESTPKGDRIISRFDGEGDVLVISYDQLRKYIARLSTLKSIELVVCDEGHRLKNAEVKTTKAVDMLPTRNRVILSGTPIQNDLSEFHAMVGFVNPGILGNRDLFARVFEEPVAIGRDPEAPEHLKTLGHDRAHYLSTLTQRFILRRTQSINESYLPPKVDVTVFVRLGEQQQKAYESLASVVENAACTPLVLISALRKLCNHMDLFHDAVQLSQSLGQSGRGRGAGARNEEEEGAPARRRGAPANGIPLSVLPRGFRKGSLDAASGSKLHFVSLVLEELRQNGEKDKLVIVSNFTQTLDIIAALCQKKKIGYFQLDGSTPIKKRQELVDYFNVPGSQEVVFLLSSKAGGVGLNLIGANRLILFDPDWNPANDAQAMGRVWRDGQKKRVFIYRLLSTGTIEEKIYQRQVSKQGLSANVVDMQEDSKQHFTLDELKSLFKYKADTLSDTHDLLGCTECEAEVQKRAAEAKSKKSAVAADSPGKMQFRKVGEKKKQSGPRMDELKAWRHIADIANFALDKVTRVVAKHAPTLLSFLFADERDNTTKVVAESTTPLGKGKAKATPSLRVERPFADDEAAIICASQATLQEEESQVEIEIIDDSEDESEFASSEDEDGN